MKNFEPFEVYSSFPQSFHKAESCISQVLTKQYYRWYVAQRRCVYFNEDNHQWTSGPDICTVGNDLTLGVDDFVDCSCKHMSVYAVRVSSVNPIYPIWFHISCFICLVSNYCCLADAK